MNTEPSQTNGAAAPTIPPPSEIPATSVALMRRSPLEQVRELATYLEDLELVATTLCKATILPKAMQAPANLKLVLMQGLAMGFDVIQSIRASFIIEPKKEGEVPRVGYYVDALVALVRSSDKCRFFRVEESSAARSRVVCARADEPDTVIHTFDLTRAEASASNMDKSHFRDRATGEWRSEVKYQWQAMPADMLNARNCGRACKRVFQDVVFGMSTPDDLDDIIVADRERVSEGFIPVPMPSRASPAPATPAPASSSSEPVVVRDPETITEAELVGTGDDAWDEFLAIVKTMSSVDTADWLPNEFIELWDKRLDEVKTRADLNAFAPLIGEAQRRVSRSKSCSTVAAHMATSFNARTAKLREAEKARKP